MMCVSRQYECAWNINDDNCEYRLRPKFPPFFCVFEKILLHYMWSTKISVELLTKETALTLNKRFSDSEKFSLEFSETGI